MNTFIMMTEQLTGANWIVVWIFPILAIAIFLLSFLPIIGQNPLTRFVIDNLKKVALIYTGVLSPGYETFKTIEGRENTNPKKMLSYWLIVALSYVIFGILQAFVWDALFSFLFYLTILILPIWDYFLSGIIYKLFVRTTLNYLRNKYGRIRKEENHKE